MPPNDLRDTDSSESEPVSRRSTVLALLAPARPLAVRERLLVQVLLLLLHLRLLLLLLLFVAIGSVRIEQ